MPDECRLGVDPMTLAPLTLLDQSVSALRRGPIGSAMEHLTTGLEHYRKQLGADTWRRFTQQNCRAHELWTVLGQDPVTQLSRNPSLNEDGHPNWLEAMRNPSSQTSPLKEDSRQITDFLSDLSLASALRHRRTYRGIHLHRLTGSISQPRILATDPGRGPSAADGNERIHQVFLGTPPGNPNLPQANPRQLDCVNNLERTLQRGGMHHSHDLVHALDALDNIDDATARQIVPLLFDLLRPGGRLILSSFAPELPSRAYIEAFMNLWFAYRDEDRLWSLGSNIPRSEINETHLSRDSDDLTVRLEIVKR